MLWLGVWRKESHRWLREVVLQVRPQKEGQFGSDSRQTFLDSRTQIFESVETEKGSRNNVSYRPSGSLTLDQNASVVLVRS